MKPDLKTMTQTEIIDAISAAFKNLCELDGGKYVYWLDKMYSFSPEGEETFIFEEWNETNLKLMETDVEILTRELDESV